MSKRKLIIPICLMVAAISGVILGSGSVSASPSAGVEVSANIQEFLRMALDTNSLAFEDSEGNTTISPSPSGTLASGNVNVAVTTNTDKGFTISAYTHGATTDMTNTNTDLSASIPSVSTATGYDSTTGLSALPTDTWGFRKKTGENTYGNWFGVGTDDTHATVIENSDSSSSEYCSTLAYPLNTSSCSAGTYAEHTLNFGANLTPALPAGTYTNDVIISAVAKSEGARYMINFDSNGGQNTMASRSIIAGSTFNLPATTNVTNGDYELSGFAFTSSATSPAYTPGQTVNVNDFLTAATSAGQDIDAGITLYLIWEQIFYMQDFDCTSLANIGDITTLVDSRDNHEYHVKKLSDGNCWMIDNLTISATGMVADALDNTNTNIPSSDTNKYYLPPQNMRNDTADSITSSATKTVNTAVSFIASYSNQPQVGYRAQGNTNNNGNAAMPENTAYYNFYTASLGFSYYNDGKTSGSSPRDICPKGWRLPWSNDYGTASGDSYSYNGSAELYKLALAYNGTSSVWSNYIAPTSTGSSNPYTLDATVHQNMVAGDSGSLDRFVSNGAAGFTYVGEYNATTVYNVGTVGFYWSSSVYDTYDSYALYFNTTDVYPQNHGGKSYGGAVRCIAGTRS